MLKEIANLGPNKVYGREHKGRSPDFHAMASIPRLLDKNLLKVVGSSRKVPPPITLLHWDISLRNI